MEESISFPQVLLVEDDEVDAEWVCRLLREHSEVTVFSTAHEARAVLAKRRFDCLLLDYSLPDVSEAEFVKECSSLDIPVVVLSGHSDADQAVSSMKAGAHDYFVKDMVDRARLQYSIEQAIDKRSLRIRLEENEDELERAREYLFERERRLSLILETIREVFWIAGSDQGQFLYLSPQASVVWGIEPSLPRAERSSILARVVVDDRETVQAAWYASEDSYEVEYRFLNQSGEKLWLRERATRTEENGRVVWVGTTEDITQRKTLENQFLHSQKMEALGRLAGSLAHDFNNLLTCMLGYTQVIREQSPSDAFYLEDLTQVEEAGNKAKALVRQLLVFSKTNLPQNGRTDLRGTVLDLRKMFDRTIGEDISFSVDVPDHPLEVPVEKSRVEQILINLAINARDAMPQGGQLNISLKAQKGYAVLSVTDSGSGIPEEIQTKIFEPFFTTKGERGSGLGLSTVFGIVRDAGGTLQVESQPGSGTAFVVSLPWQGQETLSGEDQVSSLQASDIGTPQPAKERKVLVVENRDPLRRLFCSVLVREGYRVVPAADGLDAFLKGGDELESFSALVTDVKMPGVGGRELARRCRERKPDLPVLYVTGYSGDEFADEPLGELDAILEKPFTGPELAKTLDALISKAECKS